MAQLEELTQGTAVGGILPDELVTVVSAAWIGSDIVDLTYRSNTGRLGSEMLYRDMEHRLSLAEAGRHWSFDGDGEMLRLVSEAYRIHLAYLFDPVLAVHTSMVDPLPHQITAVYEEMLPRQPLRFLLADDPGAGKTIMAGLLIKELIMRGDLRRCLIVCPGSLVEQWQDELYHKFNLDFDIVTRESVERSRSGNPFAEGNLLIARLDYLARNDEMQGKLAQTDWDLVVCDEAHKMSASYFSGEVKETKRYKLGKRLAEISRHFLLLSATPHNGKEEDFQLFMALLDGDRFEGRFRDGAHVADTSDLIRRMVKEELLKFDGTPLFPERIATTVTYSLSDAEAALYGEVTQYVREEMNRADRLSAQGEGRRGNNVGFALTILQRRLASSPEAIYQSLRRRRERLAKRLREEQIAKRGAEVITAAPANGLRTVRDESFRYLTDEDLEDLEEAPESEVEKLEEEIADKATAARTIEELQLEIDALGRLEELALRVRQLGTDRKWDELSRLLQSDAMFDAAGNRRKLIIFTEHRDTLNYLRDRITSLLGRPESVVTIHGSLAREERRRAQEQFTQDKDVQVLLATDAAGEGVNLQRAHLMVNYDLPWNPNRIEQRFGRIHRIGQREVCHLWNLVAGETREGEVFLRLFAKLEEERAALGGKVFDVLGKVFGNEPLRVLLLQAIRYGDRPEVRERLERVVDTAMDREHLTELLEERALARDSMDTRKLMRIKEEMERAEARRLQPHFISAFFLEAFRLVGGAARERESGRYEITRVPGSLRARDRQIGFGAPILPKYERVTFEKDLVAPPGKPLAAFLCPGHPLLDATIDLVLEQHRDLLKRGAVLVDPNDGGMEPRALVYLEHAIQDAQVLPDGERRTVSRRVQFVEIDANGTATDAGVAPYLDYRPATTAECLAVEPDVNAPWLRGNLEGAAREYAARHLLPRHLREIQERREATVTHTLAAVKERLSKEIRYWDHRASQLRERERAGKQSKLNSQNAQRRADDLEQRLRRRTSELEAERHVSAKAPIVVGGALIIPAGLLRERIPETPDGAEVTVDAAARRRIELAAMEAVMGAERDLGRIPRDVSAQNVGYDIESRLPESGSLLFLEVKGRAKGATTVTVSKNEMVTGLNKPDQYVLALVEVDGVAGEPRYVRHPPFTEPPFPMVSATFDLAELLEMAEPPA